jgi:serine/threonine-protein kinase SRK2
MDTVVEKSKYQKIRDINSGTFGFVELALDKTTGQQVAIKFIDRGEKVTKYVQREILNHRCLMHPHVVQFKEVFLTPQYLAIAMEFVAGGDMFEFVVSKKGLKESEARWFFQQLIVGVDYLHRMEIASRDIKLENTLLDTSPRPLVKICDFGYSKHEKFHSAPGSRVGTPAYLAPEVIMTTKGQTYDGKISDIWSCGVMLYVMLVGGYPFERPEDKHDQQKLQKMIQRILKVEYDFPSNLKVSKSCRDLLSKILVDKPEKRITIAEIQKHPWYVEDLPPGVAEMNDNLPSPGPEVQSAEQITAIVEEARKSAQGVADWDNDEYLDGALNQEDYAGSYDEWGMNGSI